VAVTNINNLDGLDAVDNINAADEVIVKSVLQDFLFHTHARAAATLFIGQMAAEGFANVSDGQVRITVESPTIKVAFYHVGSYKTRAHMYEKVSGAWRKISEKVYDGQFSAAGA
jgi:hypothetical protein